MSAYSKFPLAALISAFVLAVAVGSAAANRLSISEQGFRIVYSPINFVPSFGTSVRCPVTLEGTLHARTSPKASGALAGFITRASIGTCEAARARFDTETLPWHVQYVSFAGTLPSITSITLQTLRPSWEVPGEIFGLRVNCRYTPARRISINTRDARGIITEHRPGEESFGSETAGCPEGRLTGTASVKTPTGSSIVVSLI